MFLLSKLFQNVEFEIFLQLSFLILLILFGINSLRALNTVRNEFSNNIYELFITNCLLTLTTAWNGLSKSIK